MSAAMPRCWTCGICARSSRQLQQECCPHAAEVRIPVPFREIRAFHSASTVRVYQAYNDAIADAAVAGNSFRAPLEQGLWSATRMTWVKPSAVWMAYRCGWTLLKDKNQRRVVALDISRPKFVEMLMRAHLSHSSEKTSCKSGSVVVQWDPERRLCPTATSQKDAFTHGITSMRSIQIGLRGDAVQALLDPEVVTSITDVTESFRTAGQALQATPPDLEAAAAALWPEGMDESELEIPAALREVLQMDAPAPPEYTPGAASGVAEASQE
mmetsp:Transcript_46700/g.111065  ORF Transcript_46700/g.111065 Transcript_46700/m.111065 type:complete len:269 (+) Transcript_46700:47-853(+)